MDQGVVTFGEITTHAADFVQEPSTKFLTMLKRQVNDDLSMAAQKIMWPQLLSYYRNSLNFVAGNPKFYCPGDVLTPLELIDETNGTVVDPINFREIFKKFAGDYDHSSSVFSWSSIGDSCKTQDFNSVAEKIQIVSSLSADTSKQIRVVYKDSNGIVLDEAITTNASNGTTAVQSSATISDLLRISTSSTRAGVITISGVTSSNVYARIGPRENTALYKVLFLVMFPSAANLATLIYKRSPLNLINDDDIPEIPVGQYLRKMAIGFSQRWMGKTAEAEVYYRDAEADLMGHLNSSKDPSKSVTLATPRIPWRNNRAGGWR